MEATTKSLNGSLRTYRVVSGHPCPRVSADVRDCSAAIPPPDKAIVSAGPRFCPRCAAPLVSGEQGGVERMFCAQEGCGYVHWDNPVPVVAAIVEHEGRIVLGRNALWPPEMFALITGFLERHDPDPAAGVLREVQEELGLSGHVAGFVGHYAFPRMNQLIIAFHVIAEGSITLDPELVEYRHVPFDQLRPWPGATGNALRDWMLARGLTPLPYEPAPLKAIRNYRQVDRRLAVAGQPESLQFKALRYADFHTVINLALDSSPGAIADEREQIEALGMRYHHIPVQWEAPTAEDFEQFSAILDREGDRRVLVHCAAAKRASAFVFLHRVLRQGRDPEQARAELHAVWQPDEIWAGFIHGQLERAGLASR